VKIVLQRVKQAAVEVEQKVVGEIGQGVCLFVGIEKGDTQQEAHYLANKIVELRVMTNRR
jgi:D-tyrosyl-tRNA(Tyr) deacylase